MIMAKQIKNIDPMSKATIIHFYGEKEEVEPIENNFKIILENTPDHPFNILLSLGFTPIGDRTFILTPVPHSELMGK